MNASQLSQLIGMHNRIIPIIVALLVTCVFFLSFHGGNDSQLEGDVQTKANSTFVWTSENHFYFHHDEQPSAEHGKIVMDLGLPRTGTTSWVKMMRSMYPGKGGEFDHYFWWWDPADLLELLLLGNRTSPENPLYKMLTKPPETVRAIADLPVFLLAPIAHDFPHVYWIQVTRNIEEHIKSTRYMLAKWAQDRCKCAKAPRCVESKILATDRLYNDKYNAMGIMCLNNGNASAIPSDLLRSMIKREEETIKQHMQNHPHFLQLVLEDGTEANMKKMAEFLDVDITRSSINFKSLHVNKREFDVK